MDVVILEYKETLINLINSKCQSTITLVFRMYKIFKYATLYNIKQREAKLKVFRLSYTVILNIICSHDSWG